MSKTEKNIYISLNSILQTYCCEQKTIFFYQLSQNKKFQFGFDFIHPDAGFFYYHNTGNKLCTLLWVVLVFNSHNFPTSFFLTGIAITHLALLSKSVL